MCNCEARYKAWQKELAEKYPLPAWIVRRRERCSHPVQYRGYLHPSRFRYMDCEEYYDIPESYFCWKCGKGL